jgi:hypothetical protein
VTVPVTITEHRNPAAVLRDAGPYLATEPARSHQVRRILTVRTGEPAPAPGHYWIACDGDRVVGAALQSPAHMPLVLSPMGEGVAAALAGHVSGSGLALPGVRGEAAAAAAFAGRWTDERGTGAVPVEGQRLYELGPLTEPPGIPGCLRSATAADRDLLVAWTEAFHQETGNTPAEPAAVSVDTYLASGELWVWDDGEPRATTLLTDPNAGVAHVGMVYTPPEERNRGWASALVAGLSAQPVRAGHPVIL